MSRKLIRVLLSVFVLLAFALAGCGGGSSENGTPANDIPATLDLTKVNLYLDGVRIEHGCVQPEVSDLITANGDMKARIYIYFGPTLVHDDELTYCDADDSIRLDIWNYKTNLVSGLVLPIQLSKTYGAMQYNGNMYQTVSGMSGSGEFIVRSFDFNTKKFSIEAKDVTFYEVAGIRPYPVFSGLIEGTW